MKMRWITFCIFFILGVQFSFSTPIHPDILQKRWNAQWITVPSASVDGYGVYLFRKSFDIPTKPQSFIVHVSADNRYKLYINGTMVSHGPARGDLAHWNFESVDIAPYLQPGKNILAAQVWNEGEFKPEAQISYRTAFILSGDGKAEAIVNTNSSWLCEQDKSHAPIKFNFSGYYVAGAGEARNMQLAIKHWQQLQFDDGQWQKAKQLFQGTPKNVLGPFGSPNAYMLVPSTIPQMELKDERLFKVAFVKGNINIPDGFPSQQKDIQVPANSMVTLLLDQNYLTNAYFNLTLSGGKGASISLKYAEALYKNNAKGNRNEVEGKTFIGRQDSIVSDGTDRQRFTSLTYRTFRYVQLQVRTKEESLIINDLYGTFTGYPFVQNASLTSSNAELSKILEIGWRTARLCAVETYMDCPYYEQLQYIGDGRIQALISLYNSGDDRLVKNALNLMDYSRQPEGVTLSRHPSYTPQYIPTFSLWYIGMLSDYARYGADLAFVKQKLNGVRSIVDYFSAYQQKDGSLKNVPQWMFTDWVDNFKDWQAGVGPMSADGTSAVLDFQLLLALQTAAELENTLGNKYLAAGYQTKINQLAKTIRIKYWDKDKKLFADRKEKDVFSKHTNALAILTSVATPAEMKEISKQLIENNTLAPASIYFKYYLHLALTKAGLGDYYLSWLDKWRENIQMGLTTWAEMSDVDKSRSDCHAWGASPNIEFYRILLGIDSDGLGFSKVKIEPHLGEIKKISGKIPHPNGEVVVDYHYQENKWKIFLSLPKSTTGSFIWKGKTYPLIAGVNKFSL